MSTFGLSKRAHFRALALQTPPKFHEKTPREGRKKENCGGRGQKKREILGCRAEGESAGAGSGGGPSGSGRSSTQRGGAANWMSCGGGGPGGKRKSLKKPTSVWFEGGFEPTLRRS